MGWLGNEATDKWANVGALDRKYTRGNAVEKLFAGNLRKARAVVQRLSQGV